MEIIIIIIACIALGVGFLLRAPKWQSPQSTQADAKTLKSYAARDSIFVNSSEHAFFHALLNSQPDGYRVFAKVRLEDILQVRDDIKDPQMRWQLRGRVKSRHVDFVICDASGRFICAVELDGSAHSNDEAKMVDGFKDEIFRNAGLNLYRAKTGTNFNVYARKLWENLALGRAAQ